MTASDLKGPEPTATPRDLPPATPRDLSATGDKKKKPLSQKLNMKSINKGMRKSIDRVRSGLGGDSVRQSMEGLRKSFKSFKSSGLEEANDTFAGSPSRASPSAETKEPPQEVVQLVQKAMELDGAAAQGTPGTPKVAAAAESPQKTPGKASPSPAKALSPVLSPPKAKSPSPVPSPAADLLVEADDAVLIEEEAPAPDAAVEAVAAAAAAAQEEPVRGSKLRKILGFLGVAAAVGAGIAAGSGAMRQARRQMEPTAYSFKR